MNCEFVFFTFCLNKSNSNITSLVRSHSALSWGAKIVNGKAHLFRRRVLRVRSFRLRTRAETAVASATGPPHRGTPSPPSAYRGGATAHIQCWAITRLSRLLARQLQVTTATFFSRDRFVLMSRNCAYWYEMHYCQRCLVLSRNGPDNDSNFLNYTGVTKIKRRLFTRRIGNGRSVRSIESWNVDSLLSF